MINLGSRRVKLTGCNLHRTEPVLEVVLLHPLVVLKNTIVWQVSFLHFCNMRIPPNVLIIIHPPTLMATLTEEIPVQATVMLQIQLVDQTRSINQSITSLDMSKASNILKVVH